MDRTLQHFNQYSTDSPMEWPGLHSNRFPKPRLMHPRRDLIQSGTPLSIQGSTSQSILRSQVESTMRPVEAKNISSNRVWDSIKILSTGTLDKALKK